MLKSSCFQSIELKSETVYAAECPKLSVKIESELFKILYNTDAEINIIIKTAVNTARLLIQFNSTMNLRVYDDENYSFVKTYLNVKVNCREVKCYTLIFIVEKVVYNLLLKRSYQIVT